MKKQILMLALLLTSMGTVMAQDTLTMSGPKPNYMINGEWFPGATFLSWDCAGSVQQMAVYQYTEDVDTIYGIAAILMTQVLYAEALEIDSAIRHRLKDTTLDNVEGYLRLYDAGDGTLIKHNEELTVHMKYTPVSYYLSYDIDTLHFAGIFPYNYLFPVYERYFEQPVAVVDSFYVGLSNKDLGLGPFEYHDQDWVQCPWFNRVPPVYGETNFAQIAQQQSDSSWIYRSIMPLRYFIFPILTPGQNLPDLPHDTTGVDTTIVDTVGIGMVQLVERYVHLMPNPAAERVTVTSSFGLQQVELYDAAGTRVLSQRLAGYSASLDISALPAGAYLARIATPSGTVTKKLIIQRR